jgi:hypothetical protein
MIPKIIHYCWFGKDHFSDLMQLCIHSWEKYCPDWEIIKWNEENSPLDIPFVQDALKHQKWAFVSDYVRFYALYHYVGVYLDTDMLLTKPLNALLSHKVFLERVDLLSVNYAINGSEKNNPWCLECIERYKELKFDVVSPPINGTMVTQWLYQYGLLEKDITQRLRNGIYVYSSEWFYPIHYSKPFSVETINDYLTENTHAVHLWNCSWKSEITMLSEGDYHNGFKQSFRRISRSPFLPIRYYKKLFKYTLIYLHLYHE